MVQITRKQCRKALADYLKPDLDSLVSSSWILDYQMTDFDGATPVVQVTSSGVDLDLSTKTGRTLFFYTVEVFVLHKHTESGWTELNAEDLLDDIEEAIMACIFRVKTEGPWKTAYLGERTLTTRMKVSADTYLYETFPIIAEVM